MTNLQVFYISDSPLGGMDAKTTHVKEVCENLAKYCQITLFTPQSKNDTNYQGSLIEIPSTVLPLLKFVFYQLLLLPYLAYYCCIIKPDLIYSRHSDYIFSPAIISKIFGVPLIIEINGLSEDEMVLIHRSKIKVIIERILSKINRYFTYRQARGIIAVTPRIKSVLSDKYHLSNIYVVPNGVNVGVFQPIANDIAISKLNLIRGKKYVCFVGRLAPWQGVEYLIRASTRIIAEEPDVCFLIVGDGPERKEWQKMVENLHVQDYFIFTGNVPYETVPLYINSSEVCVVYKRPLPSGYSPLKLYEYAACSKPIIASDVDGFEFIREKNAGILVQPDNPEALENAILAVLKNDDSKKQMGLNGRKYVMENHSWEEIAKRLFSICLATMDR